MINGSNAGTVAQDLLENCIISCLEAQHYADQAGVATSSMVFILQNTTKQASKVMSSRLEILTNHAGVTSMSFPVHRNENGQVINCSVAFVAEVGVNGVQAVENFQHEELELTVERERQSH